MKLYRVILPVKGIESAVRFYSQVFEQAGERVSPGRHYFECGGVVLACYDPVADGDDLASGWVHHSNQYVYFAVSDLPATLKQVEAAGGEIVSTIERMPWGETLFYARDPSGNPISFADERTTFTGGSGA
ncbi:MAG: VOC family protein [Acidobacteria bacterium]|nr:VOC family protein [Acidobacteriota bacterium]